MVPLPPSLFAGSPLISFTFMMLLPGLSWSFYFKYKFQETICIPVKLRRYRPCLLAYSWVGVVAFVYLLFSYSSWQWGIVGALSQLKRIKY